MPSNATSTSSRVAPVAAAVRLTTNDEVAASLVAASRATTATTATHRSKTMPPTHLDYRVTLTRPDGSVVKTLTVPVLQESADAEGNASSRLDFGIEDFTALRHAEQALTTDLKGLENAACQDANERAIAVVRSVGTLARTYEGLLGSKEAK